METCKKNVLFIYLGVLMFLFSQVSHVSSASDTISTNHPLSGFHTIVSNGDIFEFGFFNPAPGRYENFYIGMWYKQVSPRTIVWVANRESPPLRDNSNSILKISDGNLILYDNITATALWSTGLNSSSSKDVQAVLLDNGNLVLRDGPTSSAAVLWQSFDHPSDTWLPGAKIWINNIKLGSQRLTSWNDLKDPSPGNYALQVDPNITHSLIAVSNGFKSYWSSGPWDDQHKIFQGFSGIYFTLSVKLNLDESYITYSVDSSYSTYRLVMDVSGRFMLKVWDDNTQSWNVYFSQPENRCEVYDYCGAFGICNDNQEPQPCSCVPGFKPERQVWDSDDFFGTCIMETELQCGKGNDEFLPIKNMKLATDPTTILVLTESLVTTCASRCLTNCSCKAYAYDGNKCLMWASDAFNLQQLDANQGHTFFLRRAASNFSIATSNKGKTKHSKGRRIVLLVVLSSLVAAAAFFVALYCYISPRRRRNRTQRDEKQSRELLEGGVIDDDGEHMCYLNLHNIMAATNAFSEENKLGEGGFGPVYKGKLTNGMDVAIKRLSKKSSQGTMKQRNIFSILCSIFVSFGVASVSAQQCMNNGNFIPNSTYDENRSIILSSLPSKVKAQDGFFYNGSIGKEPNRVYAIGMCIPGSAPDDCYVCIDTAFKGLIKSCPKQTEAYSWPGDPTLCLVRYSNSSFSGSADLDPHILETNNTGDITSNLTEFKTIWEDLIGRMIAEASAARSTPSSSNNHYTANVAALTKFQNIYALMQCTPDISPGDCEKCLKQSVMVYQSCCGQKQGGVVLQSSCYFKWELFTFSKAFDNITVASPPPVTVPKTTDSKGISAGVVVAITVPTVVTVLILLVLGFFLCRRRKSYQKVELNQTGITTVRSLQFKFKTIEAATNKFSKSNKIGQGGFGDVFKGTLPDGTEIAVKRLFGTSEQSNEEFKNEVLVVAKLQHRNLVRLLGFSVKGKEKIIVYEFLPNKSLDFILFDPTKQRELDWTKRFKIIGGIARGILYLHQDSRLTIIHRDLKAGNILLDADMNPKVADFGTARIFGMDQTRSNTQRIVGTEGYMSPEYMIEGQFSMKSDVYSFGVLVLEIICGRTNRSFSPVQNLVTYAWRLWRNGSPIELVDPAIAENYHSEEVTRCIHIALLCVQKDPTDRLDFSSIMSMLTSNSLILPVPQPPGFLDLQNKERDGFMSSQFTMGSTCHTINDVTIT